VPAAAPCETPARAVIRYCTNAVSGSRCPSTIA
jgi:hypothetical protein